MGEGGMGGGGGGALQMPRQLKFQGNGRVVKRNSLQSKNTPNKVFLSAI